MGNALEKVNSTYWFPSTSTDNGDVASTNDVLSDNAAQRDDNEEGVDEETKQGMNKVLQELTKIFDERQENAQKKRTLEESWFLINSIGEFSEDEEDIEEDNFIGQNQQIGEGELKSEKEKKQGRTTTLAWVNGASLSFVSYFWPKLQQDSSKTSSQDSSVGPSTPSMPNSSSTQNEKNSEFSVGYQKMQEQMKQQMEALEQMKAQIEFLQQSMLMEHPQKQIVKVVVPSSPRMTTHHYNDELQHENSQENSSDQANNGNHVEMSSSPVFGSPPPPPPPPPPSSKGKGTLTIGTIPLAKKEKIPRTREQIAKEIKELIFQSDILDVNKQKAFENFMKAFPEKYNNVLEQMLDYYSFLIVKMPLQPKTCYKRAMTWEKKLFKNLDETVAKALRNKKKFEIEKLNTDSQIGEEISKILQVLEYQKKKEAEEKKEKERKETMGNIIGELKEKMERDRVTALASQAEQELKVMEEGSIDDLMLSQ